MAKRLFTKYPPQRPVLLWDGECGFCKYWMLKWRRTAGDQLDYEPYQEQIENYPDVPEEKFAEAVKYAEPDGTIYSGAEAALRTLSYNRFYKWLYRFYLNFKPFRWGSDGLYKWVSDNRPLLYNVTVHLFGSNPARPQYYWLLYVAGLVGVIVLLVVLL